MFKNKNSKELETPTYYNLIEGFSYKAGKFFTNFKWKLELSSAFLLSNNIRQMGHSLVVKATLFDDKSEYLKYLLKVHQAMLMFSITCDHFMPVDFIKDDTKHDQFNEIDIQEIGDIYVDISMIIEQFELKEKPTTNFMENYKKWFKDDPKHYSHFSQVMIDIPWMNNLQKSTCNEIVNQLNLAEEKIGIFYMNLLNVSIEFTKINDPIDEKTAAEALKHLEKTKTELYIMWKDVIDRLEDVEMTLLKFYETRAGWAEFLMELREFYNGDITKNETFMEKMKNFFSKKFLWNEKKEVK